LLDLPNEWLHPFDRTGHALPPACWRRRADRIHIQHRHREAPLLPHLRIKSFYIPRSHPDGIDVNVHCLDAATIESVDVQPFDDADRDAATAAIEHLSR